MVPHHESQQQPRQAVSRLGLYLPTALLIAVAVAWCGFWFYAGALLATLAIGIAAAFVLDDVAASSDSSAPKRWVGIVDLFGVFWLQRRMRRATLVSRESLGAKH